MAAKNEQETTVNWPGDGSLVQIWTNVPKHLRRLRADKRVNELSGDDEAGFFYVDPKDFDPITGLKRTRVEMTPEQRDAAAARLAAARAMKGVPNGEE